jgi:glycosyltransferase involved in cell wall biosynthesis
MTRSCQPDGAITEPLRVGYVAGEPTQFRVPHLDLIADRPEVDLTVIYAAATVQRREWNLSPRHEPVVLRGPKVPATPILHHDFPLTPQIWALLTRERFDVVVIAGWSLLATWLAIVWCRVHRVPYLLVSENHDREPRPQWIRILRRLVLPRIVRRAGGYLPTGSLAQEHLASLGARVEDSTFFPNTVDVPRLSERVDQLRAERDRIRASLGIPSDSVVILFLGRFIRLKAVDVVIRAAAVASRRASSHLHLLLVGSGPLEGELRKLAAESGTEATFAGWRSERELPQMLAVADLFVLASRREPWGTVVVEAAAAGLPLVLSDRVGAGADLVVPRVNGELVPADDVEALADAFVRISDDPIVREQYGRHSRVLATRWGYEPSVETFIAAVRRAAGRP